ncbi:hypothetical protein AAFF_G00373670 [Aldrovandia affinis]|uniref:Starch-binding domain-containing protein 1 n=1 Tax=Aldrovandia affinis TaxID=143900 RepID=A0AAD7WMB1_9TELE|nr:hypothetical protein AAFF_G00373670 [Aldrovandia affinis]
MFQKKMQDLDRNRKLEETLRVTEINVMETTVKSHQEILTDYQHLSERRDRLSNFYHHGSLSCRRESDRRLPLSDPSEVKATGGISESKTKSLGSTMNQPLEENYETTEINIMEATMEHNEWMNVSCVEISKVISSPGNSLNGTASSGEEQRPEKPADCILVKVDIPKESGTTLVSLEEDSVSKRVAAVQPMPQMVGVSFCVHYITHTPLQFLAVTGNQQELGNWENFVPLRKAKDGFWANHISLPADSHVEWKFVLVENGKIHRWEECRNRHLQTGYEEDIHLHKWWGCV